MTVYSILSLSQVTSHATSGILYVSRSSPVGPTLILNRSSVSLVSILYLFSPVRSISFLGQSRVLDRIGPTVAIPDFNKTTMAPYTEEKKLSEE